MQLHHIGYLTKHLDRTQEQFMRLGFAVEKAARYDADRDIHIAFMTNGPCRVELIQPAGPDSPFYPLLKRYKNTPYHFCFLASDLGKQIEAMTSQGYHVVAPPCRAICLDGAPVAFLIHPDAGLIELLGPGPAQEERR